MQSKSSLDRFLRCPRSYFYHYVEGRVPREESDSIDLNFGLTFHKSIELWDNQFPNSNLPDDEIIKGSELFYGYQKTYEKVPAEKHEVEFELPKLGLKGVIDCVNASEGYFRETKTTRAWINDAYWVSLPMQPQIGLYALALSQLSTPVSHCEWDVVQRCKLKHTSRETTPQYEQRVADWIYTNRDTVYQRQLVPVTEQMISDTKKDLLDYQKLVQLSVYPKNGNSCRAFGRLCEYAEVCTGMNSIKDDALFKDKK